MYLFTFPPTVQKFPFSPHPCQSLLSVIFLIAILIGMRWYLVVLAYISLLITDAQEVVEKSYWVSVGGGEIVYWGQNRRTQETQGTWTLKGLCSWPRGETWSQCWGLVMWKEGGGGSLLHLFCGTLLVEGNYGKHKLLRNKVTPDQWNTLRHMHRC